MKIHKEGYKILRNELIVFTIIYLIGLNYWSTETLNIILIISLFFLIITLYFFRIIKRNFDRKEGVIYAPCDGKIVVIEEIHEDEYYQEKKVQISIFMSPLNMHNNLYPMNGNIIYKKHHPGKYLFAWNPKSSIDNERCTVVMKNSKISLLIRQIAGALARRIVTYSEVNETVNSCDELGFIKFGSRVDLFLPLKANVKINLHEKVIGGKSIIATY